MEICGKKIVAFHVYGSSVSSSVTIVGVAALQPARPLAASSFHGPHAPSPALAAASSPSHTLSALPTASHHPSTHPVATPPSHTHAETQSRTSRSHEDSSLSQHPARAVSRARSRDGHIILPAQLPMSLHGAPAPQSLSITARTQHTADASDASTNEVLHSQQESAPNFQPPAVAAHHPRSHSRARSRDGHIILPAH